MRSIVHGEYGEPQSVLRAVGSGERPELGAGEALVRVLKAPIHPGDLAMIRGSVIGGAPAPIDAANPRVPGFEGVGVIEALGADAAAGGVLREGMRVAFFPALGAWRELVPVHAGFLCPVPEGVADGVGAQMLINSITASMIVRDGLQALPADAPPAVAIQTAAGSAVGRLVTVVAQDQGFAPIRLVRSAEGAATLREILPGSPVISTSDDDWPEQLRIAIADRPVGVVFDGVGGELIDQLVPFLAHRGTVINYGDMGPGKPDIRTLVAKENAIRGLSILNWLGLPEDVRAADIAVACRLAHTMPDQFRTSGEFEPAQIASAVAHVGKPGKHGAVMLNF